MILNGKGCLTGCGLHGHSLVPILYRVMQYGCCLFIDKTFLLVSSTFFFVVLLFVYMIVEQWRRSGGLHQVRADWWRVSCTYKYYFSNFFKNCCYTLHIITHYVLLLLSSVPIFNMSKMSYHILLLLLLHLTYMASSTASFVDLVTLHR